MKSDNHAWVGGFILSIIFCFWMNISLREFKCASRSSSFMSLADGSEMAFVTLSAVAGERGHKEALFDSWGVTCLVFPHLDEGLHLGDPLLDGLVHPLPSLNVGSILLVRLTKDNKKSAALLVSYLPLHGWSSSVRRRYRCQEPSWSLRTLPSSASPEYVRIAFAFLNWRIQTAPHQTSSFLPQGWKHSSYHSSLSPLTWCVQRSEKASTCDSYLAIQGSNFLVLLVTSARYFTSSPNLAASVIICLRRRFFDFLTCLRFCVESSEGILYCVHPPNLDKKWKWHFPATWMPLTIAFDSSETSPDFLGPTLSFQRV